MTRKIILIPIWLMTLCLKPFLPQSHPWKHQDTTLEWWNRGATDDAWWYSLAGWFMFIAIIPVFLALFK